MTARRTRDTRSDFLSLEACLTSTGYSVVCGVDEAGRGPLAGPVVAAAVVLPLGVTLPGLTDSKLLTPASRERLYGEIELSAVAISLGMSDVALIDQINILQATLCAMREAVRNLHLKADYVLVDGPVTAEFGVDCRGIIGGDRAVRSIAAASIIAKVTRDRIMERYDEVYPGYGFAQHKGYCTPGHVRAIHALGRCPIHRKSFNVPDLVSTDE